MSVSDDQRQFIPFQQRLYRKRGTEIYVQGGRAPDIKDGKPET